MIQVKNKLKVNLWNKIKSNYTNILMPWIYYIKNYIIDFYNIIKLMSDLIDKFRISFLVSLSNYKLRQ